MAVLTDTVLTDALDRVRDPNATMIATDTPGCREIAIRDETALTFPVDDVPALADAMTRMAGDAEMRARFGKTARELVESKFSAYAIGKQTVALYQSLKPS